MRGGPRPSAAPCRGRCPHRPAPPGLHRTSCRGGRPCPPFFAPPFFSFSSLRKKRTAAASEKTRCIPFPAKAENFISAPFLFLSESRPLRWVAFRLILEKKENRQNQKCKPCRHHVTSQLPGAFARPKSPYVIQLRAARYLDDGGQATSCGYATSCRGGRLCPPVPNCDPAQRSQFGKEEGASGYGAFAAPAEAECSWLLLTPRCAERRDLTGGRV